jgi:drug/metabolite transporter (DMT)-like permease
MNRGRAVAILQTLGVMLANSLGTVLMKMALNEELHPLTLAWTTTFIGMVALSTHTFVVRRERIPRGLGRRVWYYMIAIGICNFVISRISRPLALERLPATTTTFLGNFIGLVTMGMSIFILKERPSVFQVLGALVALTGLTIFFLELPTTYEFIGMLLVLVGIVAVAYTNNIARKLAIVTDFQLSNTVLSSVALLVGGSITLLIGLSFDWPPRVPTWKHWGIIFYIGLVPIGFGLTLWNHILRTLRSFEASILGASSVIWTAILAIILLGESLALNEIAGITLLIGGLALVQVRQGEFGRLFRRAPVAAQEAPLEKVD